MNMTSINGVDSWLIVDFHSQPTMNKKIDNAESF